MKFKIVLSLVFAFSLSSCFSGVEKGDNVDTVNPPISKLKGKTYQLTQISYTPSATYPDGFVKNIDPDTFTIKVVNSTTISGHVLCNDYHAETIWNNDQSVNINNMDKNKVLCGDEPLQLEPRMFYRFVDSQLLLAATDRSFTATFTEVK